jgi:hypothetical protein
MRIWRERGLAAPAEACPRNVAHESTVTRPQSAPSANAISNFPGSPTSDPSAAPS